jgi:ABC-type glycerol-3-phosphate transport system substrate-binding protein
VRRLLASIITVVAVAVIPACGAAGHTVEIVGLWTGDEQRAFASVADAFRRATGIEVDYIALGDDLPTVLETRIAGGDPPDVAVVAQPGLLRRYVAANVVVPLGRETRKGTARNFSPTWRRFASVDGVEYGVYLKAAYKSVVWYRDDVLADAGVIPPSTLDDFVRDVGALADTGVPPLAVGAADGWVLTDWFENIYLRTAGPDRYRDLTARRIRWTDPTVRHALTVMDSLLRDDYLLGGAAGAVRTDFADSVRAVFGPRGSGAMVYGADFVAGLLGPAGRRHARTFDFPGVDAEPSRSGIVGGDAAVAFSDDPDTARFMAYLATPAAATLLTRHSGWLSPNLGVPPESYADEWSREFARRLNDPGHDILFDLSDTAPPGMGALRGGGHWRILQEFVAGQRDVPVTQAALEDAAAAAYGR